MLFQDFLEAVRECALEADHFQDAVENYLVVVLQFLVVILA